MKLPSALLRVAQSFPYVIPQPWHRAKEVLLRVAEGALAVSARPLREHLRMVALATRGMAQVEEVVILEVEVGAIPWEEVGLAIVAALSASHLAIAQLQVSVTDPFQFRSKYYQCLM